MTNIALYNEMYQAGYEIACKNHNSDMADDMLSMCKISNETRYEIACKYDFKEEITHVANYIDTDTAFIIACQAGNVDIAFEIYEKNMDYFSSIKHEGKVLSAMLCAYKNKHYDLIFEFVEIYTTTDDMISALFRHIITNLANDKIVGQQFIDSILANVPIDIAFKVACNCHDNRIVDSLLQNDKINLRECFQSACINGNEYVVKKLRDSCRWHYNDMLELTCKYTKNLNIIEMLVDYGADNIAECKVIADTANFRDAVKFFNDIGF